MATSEFSILNDNDHFVESAPVVEQEIERCLACSKDLSHLDSFRRTHHINKCLDKDDVKNKAVQICDNFDKTRDCPLCFEPLTPGPHRIIHYKRCCKVHNVTAAEMNELISHNDRVAQIRKRCGIVHTRARQPVRGEVETNLLTKLNKKNKVGPKNLMDEHMQTALALSMSENFIIPDEPVNSKARKQWILKQSKFPTLLETMDSESRSNLMQERLFRVVLAQSTFSRSISQEIETNTGQDNWCQTRWWRVQASENVDPSNFRTETLKMVSSEAGFEDVRVQ